MSYDLSILTQQPPTEDQVRAFLEQYPGASVAGGLTAGHNLLIEARSEGWGFTIDPPVPFDMEEAGLDPEDETMRERLAPLPCWETFLAVPYFREANGLQIAYQLAQALAVENQGWIWDPQTEELSDAPFPSEGELPYQLKPPPAGEAPLG